MGELYKLDFPNGKSYIGITTGTSTERFKGHRASAAKGGKVPLNCAWRSVGEPKLTVLAILENSDLKETEIRAIAVFNTLVPNGYNATIGGDSGCKQAPLTIEKLKVSSKRRWEDQSQREKARATAIKQFETKEAREIAAECTRKQFEKEGRRERQAEHARSIFATEEGRKAQSERRKEFYKNNEAARKEAVKNLQSPKAREKRGKIMKALWQDPEFKKKMSEAHKGKRKSHV